MKMYSLSSEAAVLRSQKGLPEMIVFTSLFAYSCFPLQPPLSYINKPKTLFYTKRHHVIVTMCVYVNTGMWGSTLEGGM